MATKPSVLVPPGFDESAVDYTDAAVLLGLAVETTLLLDRPRRTSLGLTETTFIEKGYWSEKNLVLDFDLATVEAATARALDARRRRLLEKAHGRRID